MSMSSWRAAQEPGFFGYPDDEPGYDGAEDRCHGCGSREILPIDSPFGHPMCTQCKPRFDAEAAASEQKEMDYWLKQPHTVTFEVTFDPDGAEVSCSANPAGSWLVNKEEGFPGFGVQSPYPDDIKKGEIVVDTLAEGVALAVRRMIEAQQDGSERG